MSAPLCELIDVSVRYGALWANRGVSLAVRPGEIVALCGENGAGKSTLLHALYGLVPLASGQVRYGGQAVAPSPERAIAAGVGLVHQHFMLVPTLSVAENVVLGREPRRGALLDRTGAEAEVAALGRRFGLEVDPRREVGALTVGEAQRVEILKVLYRGARLLVLDEPTAVLTPGEVTQLLGVLRGLVAGGERGMLLVTHKLDEVMAVAHRVVVLRRGEVVAEYAAGACSQGEIARAMVGRELRPVGRTARPVTTPALEREEHGAEPAPPGRTAGAAALELRGLAVHGEGRHGPRRLDGVSLRVAPGEVLGIAGVEGNGQAELCAAIADLLPARSGQVLLGGDDVTALPLRARRERGLGWVPEDRHRHGLVLDFSLAENLLLGQERRLGRLLRDRGALRRHAEELLSRYEVRPADPLAPARSLSGGNQQKLVVGRGLEPGPRVLLAAQPTRGVDVGAIEAIHRRLLEARDRGTAILLVSAELDELRQLCDRIAVLYRGRLVATLDNPAGRPLSREQLGELMTGTAAVPSEAHAHA